MLIVDSQVHTWAADTPERPWSGGGEPHRTVPFTNEDLLQEMDAAGVDRAVLVPPGWEGSRRSRARRSARAPGPVRRDGPHSSRSLIEVAGRAGRVAQAARHAGHALGLQHAQGERPSSAAASSTGCGAKPRRRACR